MSPAMCEHCHENPANIRIVQQLGDQVSKHFLCEACAEKLGLKGEGINFSLASMLTAFANLDSVAGAEEERANETACSCGLTFSDFRESGRLGCARCYDTFSPQLASLLRKIHGNTEHRGKSPERRQATVSRNREIVQLRDRLRDAVRREDYEAAAALRDRIRVLAPPASAPEAKP